MNKEGHEDSETKFRISVVGREGNETFREFVESNSNRSLKPNSKECVGRNMMMVRMGLVLYWHRGRDIASGVC